MRIAGVDIGGTSIKLGIFGSNGKMHDFIEYDTDSFKGGNYILQNLIKNIEQFERVDAIGVSTAGQVDRENGMIVQEAANIPHTSGLKIKARLESHFNVPVSVENDVNAAALGEKYFGAGKTFSDFFFLTYGTGIGGAIVIDSDIYYGRDGFAAEFGHMVTHGNGRICKCGTKGCYETYASTTALIKEAKKIDPSFVNGRIIFERYDQGDERINQVVENWIQEII